MSKVRVLYVMGTGRSGSTFLDTVLGNQPEIESVGELSKLVSFGLVNNEFCACGQRGRDCEFWQEVQCRWLGELDREAAWREMLSLQGSFERFRRWPRLRLEKLRRSERFRRYTALTEGLFRAVTEESGASVIVDSSKSAARAAALGLCPGIDLTVIHLVRDPRGVAWSYQKSFKKDERAGVQRDIGPQSLRRTVGGWILADVQGPWVRKLIGAERVVRLRYEDLVSEPVEALGRVGAVAGVDFGSLARGLAEGMALEVGHTIAGGRVRMRREVRLSPDADWVESLPRPQRDTIWRFAGRRMHRLGYPRDPGNASTAGPSGPPA